MSEYNKSYDLIVDKERKDVATLSFKLDIPSFEYDPALIKTIQEQIFEDMANKLAKYIIDNAERLPVYYRTDYKQTHTTHFLSVNIVSNQVAKMLRENSRGLKE